MKRKKVQTHRFLLSVLLGFFLLAAILPWAVAAEPVEQQLLVDRARVTFQRFMGDKDLDWYRDLLPRARGLLIVPSLLKGGFILGGSGGSGVLIVKDLSTGEWSQPAFYTIGSVTLGLQIGGEKAELIMVLRTRRAVESLYASNFKLGGDISVSAGPIGGGAKSNVLTDILTCTRSKGVYGGVSMEGAVITTKDKWNRLYYGQYVRPVDIIVKKMVSNPGSMGLREAVRDAIDKIDQHVGKNAVVDCSRRWVRTVIGRSGDAL